MRCKQTYAKKLSAVTIFAFMIILTALIPYTVYAAENSDIISVSKDSYELGAGETLYLYGETEKEFDDDVLTYATSDSSIADVNEDGNVTAVSNGKAEITITSSYGASASCTVILKNEVESFSLNYESATIGVGETTLDLNSTVTGGASNTRISTSSNEAVATVSNSGKVTGKSKGTAEITVTTFNGKTAVCTVTVKKPPTAKTVSLKESKKSKPVKPIK
ncbi:MAG: Ig-like domain-containing protein [Clostridiales bacterium]|nr:Ig-like domain-containing protein [Clostridiales bacterium]